MIFGGPSPLKTPRRIDINLNRFSTLILLLSTFFRVTSSITLDAVLVPKLRFRGQNATLLCRYHLDPNEELFSLKWYKDEQEFFRFTLPDQDEPHYGDPDSGLNAYRSRSVKEAHSNRNKRYQLRRGFEKVKGLVQTWPVPGIKINERESLPQKVELKRVTFKSTGIYRCEVTASVYTRGTYGYTGRQGIAMEERVNRMTVVEIPFTKPKITGEQRGKTPDGELQVGDVLNLTCTAAPSNPPAQLQWTINGKMIDPGFVMDQHYMDMDRGLRSSVIGLLMPLEERHFHPDGEVRVKCQATFEVEVWEEEEESVYKELKVLRVQESKWPVSFAHRNIKIDSIILFVSGIRLIIDALGPYCQ